MDLPVTEQDTFSQCPVGCAGEGVRGGRQEAGGLPDLDLLLLPLLLLFRVADEEEQPVDSDLRLDAHFDRIGRTDYSRANVPATPYARVSTPRPTLDLYERRRTELTHFCRCELELPPFELARLDPPHSADAPAPGCLGEGSASPR